MKSESIHMFLRAHTEVLKKGDVMKEKSEIKPRKPDVSVSRSHWAPYALVFDCETSIDECQSLVFGSYRFCKPTAGGIYVCIEEGFFHADDLSESDPESLAILTQYTNTNKSEVEAGFDDRLRCYSRSEFMEEVFWKAAYASDAVIVCFNAPFDLSRLAVDCKTARRRNDGWSLVMFQDKDPQTGEARENPFRPRIKINPKDSKAAFIRFGGVSIHPKNSKRRFVPYKPGRFLDLRTLGWALRNESYTLKSACKEFHAPEKMDHDPTGRITLEAVNYCRQDIRCTTGLLNQMRKEYDLHPTGLSPERAFSPASIAKGYLRAMGLITPSQKFRLSPDLLGIAMQAYYGGRAECHIRHTQAPVVLVDFLSEYPTVNTLMRLWRLLTAESLETVDATDDVRSLLESVTLDSCFDPECWKDLTFFALIQPEEDILPVRTSYNGKTTNIGLNRLTSSAPIWYAGPDVVSAAILTQRPPKVIRAIRLVGRGQQPGLKTVNLRGMVEINPNRDDFFKRMIEARASVMSDEQLPKSEREALSYSLKILASSGSYGLFVEVNPQAVGMDRKTGRPARAKLGVFSGERTFEQTSPLIEEPGAWYCPPLASLITAAGRLLLAMLERCITDRDGTYLLCDTDSMAIVSSKNGGFLSGPRRPHSSPNASNGSKILSWDDVDQIVARFCQLNPYDRSAVPDSILKVEKINFSPDKTRREIFGWAIAAKRYVLFTTNDQTGIHVEKASAHGLGFLYPPKAGFNKTVGAPEWVIEAWGWILNEVLRVSQNEPAWFQFPAVMRIAITTPGVLKRLQQRQHGTPYKDRAKPFNFVLSPILDRISGDVDAKDLILVAPFTKDLSQLHRLEWINIRDGKIYILGKPGNRMGAEVEAKTHGDIVKRFRWHPEAKSLGPDGLPCTALTSGVLVRGMARAECFRYIGKETDRRWEQGEDLSLIESPTLEYRPQETELLVADVDLQQKVRGVSIRFLARLAEVSEGSVKAARNGRRLRKSTASKLARALKYSDTKAK
jgi:hypothetical protein